MLIMMISASLGWGLLTRGHLWGDDFAGYLLQTQSILSGELNTLVVQNQTMNLRSSFSPGPTAYPWGYPLLLAPAYLIFGLNPLGLKLVGSLAFLLFLASFYFLARRSLGTSMSLLAISILGFSPALLTLNDQIQSDIPFLAITTAALFWIKKDGENETLSNKVWVGLLAFLAAFFRTNGILVLVPYGVSILLKGSLKNRSALFSRLLPFAIFLVLYIFQALVFPQGNSSYLKHFSLFSIENLFYNLVFYLSLPAQLFVDLPGMWILAIFFLVFIFLYLFYNLKHELPNLSFIGATYFLYSFWPERQGLRFILPVLPILLVFALQGLEIAIKRFPSSRMVFSGLVVVVALGSFLVSAGKGITNIANERAINGPFDPYSQQMFNFIKEETNKEDMVVFMKPRALRLFTGRNSFITTRCEDLVFGDVVVLSLKQGNNNQISPDDIDECPTGAILGEIYKNKRFIVFRRLD